MMQYGLRNSEVRVRVSDHSNKLTKQTLDFNQLWWLGHVLRMHADRLSPYAVFFEADISWRMRQSDLIMTW